MKMIKKLDIFVIVLVVFFSLYLFLHNINLKAGSYVIIEADSELIGKYNLNENRTIEILDKKNNNAIMNIVSIKDGEVFMSYSSCDDHVCENKGGIIKISDSIVCLPNKVLVYVEGESDVDSLEIDSISE